MKVRVSTALLAIVGVSWSLAAAGLVISRSGFKETAPAEGDQIEVAATGAWPISGTRVADAALVMETRLASADPIPIPAGQVAQSARIVSDQVDLPFVLTLPESPPSNLVFMKVAPTDLTSVAEVEGPAAPEALAAGAEADGPKSAVASAEADEPVFETDIGRAKRHVRIIPIDRVPSPAARKSRQALTNVSAGMRTPPAVQPARTAPESDTTVKVAAPLPPPRPAGLEIEPSVVTRAALEFPTDGSTSPRSGQADVALRLPAPPDVAPAAQVLASLGRPADSATSDDQASEVARTTRASAEPLVRVETRGTVGIGRNVEANSAPADLAAARVAASEPDSRAQKAFRKRVERVERVARQRAKRHEKSKLARRAREAGPHRVRQLRPDEYDPGYYAGVGGLDYVVQPRTIPRAYGYVEEYRPQPRLMDRGRWLYGDDE